MLFAEPPRPSASRIASYEAKYNAEKGPQTHSPAPYPRHRPRAPTSLHAARTACETPSCEGATCSRCLTTSWDQSGELAQHRRLDDHRCRGCHNILPMAHDSRTRPPVEAVWDIGVGGRHFCPWDKLGDIGIERLTMGVKSNAATTSAQKPRLNMPRLARAQPKHKQCGSELTRCSIV